VHWRQYFGLRGEAIGQQLAMVFCRREIAYKNRPFCNDLLFFWMVTIANIQLACARFGGLMRYQFSLTIAAHSESGGEVKLIPHQISLHCIHQTVPRVSALRDRKQFHPSTAARCVLIEVLSLTCFLAATSCNSGLTIAKAEMVLS
jgi:hypothetical protein